MFKANPNAITGISGSRTHTAPVPYDKNIIGDLYSFDSAIFLLFLGNEKARQTNKKIEGEHYFFLNID